MEWFRLRVCVKVSCRFSPNTSYLNEQNIHTIVKKYATSEAIMLAISISTWIGLDLPKWLHKEELQQYWQDRTTLPTLPTSPHMISEHNNWCRCLLPHGWKQKLQAKVAATTFPIQIIYGIPFFLFLVAAYFHNQSFMCQE